MGVLVDGCAICNGIGETAPGQACPVCGGTGVATAEQAAQYRQILVDAAVQAATERFRQAGTSAAEGVLRGLAQAREDAKETTARAGEVLSALLEVRRTALEIQAASLEIRSHPSAALFVEPLAPDPTDPPPGIVLPAGMGGEIFYMDSLLVRQLDVWGPFSAPNAPGILTNPMTTLGDTIFGLALGVPQRLGIGTAGQVLTVSGGVPAWANSAAGFANPMTTAGDLLFENAVPAPARLPIGATGQVLTVAGGLPAWANSPAGFANPMSAIGDLILGGTAGAATRLPIGAAGQVLTVSGGTAIWQTNPAGFTNPMTASGDMIIGTAGGAAVRLPKGLASQVLTMQGGLPTWVNPSTSAAIIVLPSGDTTGAADLTNINAALAALPATGGVILLGAGIFYVNKPIVIQQNGVYLQGSGGPVPSGDDAGKNYGTTIQPTAGFTNPTFGAFATGVILLMDQSPGVTGGTTFSPHINDLFINCINSPASVDGIATFGAIQAMGIVNVGINKATGHGINFVVDSGSSAGAPYPDGVYLSNIMIQAATGNGLNSAVTSAKASDVVAYSIHAQTCGGDGFNLNWGNGNLENCRADHCTNGFTIDSPPGGSGVMDSITLVGCSTENNNANGLNIINNSGTGQQYLRWIQVVGCKFSGDGNNSGMGLGGFAGILVSGANIVTVSDTHVIVRVNNVAGGTPQYGLATATSGTGPGKPNMIQLTGNVFNFVTSAINDAAAVGANIFKSNNVGASGFEPTTFTAV